MDRSLDEVIQDRQVVFLPMKAMTSTDLPGSDVSLAEDVEADETMMTTRETA